MPLMVKTRSRSLPLLAGSLDVRSDSTPARHDYEDVEVRRDSVRSAGNRMGFEPNTLPDREAGGGATKMRRRGTRRLRAPRVSQPCARERRARCLVRHQSVSRRSSDARRDGAPRILTARGRTACPHRRRPGSPRCAAALEHADAKARRHARRRVPHVVFGCVAPIDSTRAHAVRTVPLGTAMGRAYRVARRRGRPHPSRAETRPDATTRTASQSMLMAPS